MHESKSTKGPWHVGQGIGHGSGLYIYDEAGLLVGSADGNIHRSDEENRANAHLFGAAPELQESVFDAYMVLIAAGDALRASGRDKLASMCDMQAAKADAALKTAKGKGSKP